MIDKEEYLRYKKAVEEYESVNTNGKSEMGEEEFPYIPFWEYTYEDPAEDKWIDVKVQKPPFSFQNATSDHVVVKCADGRIIKVHILIAGN